LVSGRRDFLLIAAKYREAGFDPFPRRAAHSTQ
jgi:hypothetical protein